MLAGCTIVLLRCLTLAINFSGRGLTFHSGSGGLPWGAGRAETSGGQSAVNGWACDGIPSGCPVRPATRTMDRSQEITDWEIYRLRQGEFLSQLVHRGRGPQLDHCHGYAWNLEDAPEHLGSDMGPRPCMVAMAMEKPWQVSFKTHSFWDKISLPWELPSQQQCQRSPWLQERSHGDVKVRICDCVWIARSWRMCHACLVLRDHSFYTYRMFHTSFLW